MRKIVISCLIRLAAVLVGLLPLWMEADVLARVVAPSSVVEISVVDDLVSVQLIDAPLTEVLHRLESRFGFKTYFLGDVTDQVTLSFSDMTLLKALERITADNSLSIAFLPKATGVKDSREKQISAVWILSRDGRGRGYSPGRTGIMVPYETQEDEQDVLLEDSQDEQDADYEKNFLLDEILGNPQADKSYQRQTIQDLVEIGDSDAINAMTSYLVTQDRELRRLLVEALGKVKIEEATLALGRVLQDEIDPEIRKIAVRNLGQRKDATARGYLQEALEDGDGGVQSLAKEMLTRE